MLIIGVIFAQVCMQGESKGVGRIVIDQLVFKIRLVTEAVIRGALL